jgi:hypothetical protein
MKIFRRNLPVIVWCLLFSFTACVFVPRVFAESEETSSRVSLPSLYVGGVMFDKDRPMAIVNCRVLREGEEISGAKVVKIADSEVHFEYRGREFVRVVGEGENSAAPAAYGTQEAQCQLASVMKFAAPMMGMLILFSILSYVFAAFCLQKIAGKTKTDNEWLAWIPLFNIYLMCEIAKKPTWWMILFFIPLANIIVMIVIWMGIAEACGKRGWLGLLAFFPIVNLALLGYLAFSE